jgi:hypothetical protein
MNCLTCFVLFCEGLVLALPMLVSTVILLSLAPVILAGITGMSHHVFKFYFDLDKGKQAKVLGTLMEKHNKDKATHVSILNTLSFIITLDFVDSLKMVKRSKNLTTHKRDK